MKISLKKHIGLLAVIGLVTISCGGGGGDDEGPVLPPNEPPTTTPQLVFPSANLLCIDNNVAFDWEDATDPENQALRYEITIARDRDLTQIEEQRTVNTSNVTISLERGVAFYWNVVTIDAGNLESDPTDTEAFFTAGDGISNHVPFTAALIAPDNETGVASGTVNLQWEGGDTDVDDVLTFDVYFGTDADPALLQAGVTAENLDVTADTGMTYFWRIDTIDDSGARSIGQIWQFTAN